MLRKRDTLTRTDEQKSVAWSDGERDAPAPPEPTHRPSLHSRPRLGDLLLSRNLVDFDLLAKALERQTETGGRRLGEILVELGAIDERGLAQALAEQSGLDVVDLRSEVPSVDALARLDGDLARELRVLPISVNDDELLVVVADPPTDELRARLAEAVGGPVRFALAPGSDIRLTIDQAYRATANVERHVRAFEVGEQTRARASETQVVVVDERSPIVQVVSLILTQAVRDRASDVHLEPFDGGVRVRFRVDGALHEPLRLPPSMAQALVSRIKIMAEMNIVERRRAQDGQFEFTTDDRTLDVRVSTMATIWGEKVVMRLLDRGRSLLELPHLGMTSDTSTEFSRLIQSPYGMVICAGPTGSGKTTTLYAALNEINNPESNITTIEDPVEYILPTVNQIQINEAADITFAGGLKAILRQDPDIILVGEMRDVETTRIAVQSALTGHLVLSSLHATDAAGALQRFLDMGIESFLIASSVIAVVGQRLVRRICNHCRVPYTPSPQELAFYEDSGGAPKALFWHGEGCNFCGKTGYSDRIGVYELLVIDDEIRDLIVHQASQDKLRVAAVSQGMRPMRDEGVRLVQNDITTLGEVLRRIYVA